MWGNKMNPYWGALVMIGVAVSAMVVVVVAAVLLIVNYIFASKIKKERKKEESEAQDACASSPYSSRLIRSLV